YAQPFLMLSVSSLDRVPEGGVAISIRRYKTHKKGVN
ncbi:unnamed protein product, partial [marine sediment metagenome]